MLIIYGSHLATEIVYKMSEMEERYKINESINVDAGFDEIVEKINKFNSVIICDVPARMRNDILKYCYQENKSIYVVPKISDIIVRSSAEITYFDSPILHAHSQGLTIEQRAVKRLMDIVLSLIALIVFSPFFIIIALAIKLYDGGPVFYKQARATKDMRVFDILKFRSMIVDAEKDGPKPATNNDSRITPVGKVIRALRVDELPQILNILKGDMSIVGPRPERVEHVEKYSKEIPEFPCRYKVRGGLTGYAQVFGKYNTSAYNKLKMDLMYIQDYSLALDIKLIIMTLKILFKKDSTEGFKERKRKSAEK
jgi:exopolysaccharide biosynthesis polyprenyl glycosylphosphotransferase